ncbi:MAG: universal stress protein [Luteibaculum sp.]
MSKKKLLVATDFTPVAECAINHAAYTAKATESEVWLIHIIADESDRSEAERKLDEQVALVKAIGNKIPVETVVRSGNIYDDIKGFAEEIHASLIFMGTHGMKGMQFITGSNALKVVKESQVPFIIVQEKLMKDGGYDDIVVPITLDSTTKQKFAYAAALGSYFNATIHLITAYEPDEDYGHRVKLNLKYASKFFTERDVKHTINYSQQSGTKFADEIAELGREKNADLITIMNMSDMGIFNRLGSQLEQRVITNKEKIPVLIVNPKDSTVYSGVFSG